MIWLLLACNAPSEAELYLRALDPERSLAQALDDCAQMARPVAKGDCAAAAVQARGGLDVNECLQLTDTVFREECGFQVAERLGQAGRLDEALAACATSRFYGRECMAHVVRHQAELLAGTPPRQAEAGLELLRATDPTPDLPRLYWHYWMRQRMTLGYSVDYAECAGLATQAACEESARRIWRDKLAAMKHEKVCARRAAGQVVVPGRGGRRTFIQHPALDAELDKVCGVAAEQGPQ